MRCDLGKILVLEYKSSRTEQVKNCSNWWDRTEISYTTPWQQSNRRRLKNMMIMSMNVQLYWTVDIFLCLPRRWTAMRIPKAEKDLIKGFIIWCDLYSRRASIENMFLDLFPSFPPFWRFCSFSFPASFFNLLHSVLADPSGAFPFHFLFLFLSLLFHFFFSLLFPFYLQKKKRIMVS